MKQKDINTFAESYQHQFSIFNLNKTYFFMKVESPFIEYIPECKRNMRRLRKKIYKFITSKRHPKKADQNRKDTMTILKQATLPSFLWDIVSKKKHIDLNLIKNLNIHSRLPLTELVNMASKQEIVIKEQHQKWQQLTALRLKYKLSQMTNTTEHGKQSESKRTISSTEYEEQEELYEDGSIAENKSSYYHQQLNQSLSRHLQFNHFIIGSGFLQMQSSILSQQNLFK